MSGKIDIGFPEALLLCGTWSLISGQFSFGLTLSVLGFLGALVRTSLRIQKAQQEEQARQKLLKDLNNAGEELGAAIISLFKNSGSGSANIH